MIDLSPLFGEHVDGKREDLAFRVFPKVGPERWLLETSYRTPWHLKTWPRANLRARLIYRAAWTIARFGIHLPSRVERFAVAVDSPYAKLCAEFDHLGIFLGTPGPNRKIVVYAERPGRSIFVKIPLSHASAVLIRNETAALIELSREPELSALIPSHSLAGGHFAVENLETDGVVHGNLELSEVARIHELLERRTRFVRPLHELRADWEGAPNGMVADHDAETLALIATARVAARRFLDGLSQDMEVSCYMAHGDFTRWNVLRATDGTARIIDWELYGCKPRFFDLLHYFVSQELLVAQKKVGAILVCLEKISHNRLESNLWWQYVGLYFAYQTMYYTAVYECQKDLHRQAHQQLHVWAGVLHILNKSGAK